MKTAEGRSQARSSARARPEQGPGPRGGRAGRRGDGCEESAPQPDTTNVGSSPQPVTHRPAANAHGTRRRHRTRASARTRPTGPCNLVPAGFILKETVWYLLKTASPFLLGCVLCSCSRTQSGFLGGTPSTAAPPPSPPALVLGDLPCAQVRSRGSSTSLRSAELWPCCW